MAGSNAGFDVAEFVAQRIEDAELKHYGVKGMKWGVRRVGGAKGPAVERRPKSDDFKEAQALKKRRPSELSNSELKKLNERLQLEQNYSNLTSKRNQQTIKEGRDQVRLVMDLVKTGQLAYTVAKPGVVAVAKALKNR